MRLTVKRVEEDGVEFVALATPGEVNYLINYAVESLLQIGAITVDLSKKGQEQEVTLPGVIESDEPIKGPITIN